MKYALFLFVLLLAQPVQLVQPNDKVAEKYDVMAHVPEDYLNGVIYMDLKRPGYPKTKVRPFKDWLIAIKNDPDNKLVEIEEHTFSSKITVMMHNQKDQQIGFTFRESKGEVYLLGYYAAGDYHTFRDWKETMYGYQLIEAAATPLKK